MRQSALFGRQGTFLGGLGCVELDAGLVMHLRAGEAGGEYCQYVEILDLCSHHLCLLNTHNIKDYAGAHTSQRMRALFTGDGAG